MRASIPFVGEACSGRPSVQEHDYTLKIIRHGQVNEDAWYEAIGQDETKRNCRYGACFEVIYCLVFPPLRTIRVGLAEQHREPFGCIYYHGLSTSTDWDDNYVP